jgi:SAM-dependent methyltransferase
MSTSPLDLDPYVLPLVRGTRILDLGCGYGHWGHLVKTHYTSLRSEPVSVTGVDIFDGNVGFCRSLGVYDQVVQQDVLAYLSTLSNASVDTVIATELIEHFTREDGTEILAEIDRVTARVAILSTPNYAAFRGGGNTMLGFNEWEHHLSRWTVADFSQRGYKVLGLSHKLHKTVPGAYRLLSACPVLNALARGIAERVPSIALNLLAIKHFDQEPMHFVFGLG